MKLIKLAVAIGTVSLLSSAQMAQAALYDITGIFNEPQTMTGHTTFTGTFDWDAATNTLSGLQGTMNATMYPNANMGAKPDYNLTNQFDFSIDGAGNVVVSVFKESSTDVFAGGGYNAGDTIKLGTSLLGGDGFTPNENVYFTLAFNANTMLGNLDQMVYGDCAPTGLMAPMMTGNTCMTGHSVALVGYAGTMDGTPLSLSITPSAVPVPAAVWLFGSGLVGLIGVARRRKLA
jgi:hypothetical protein